MSHFPFDLEGAIIPFATGALAAALLPRPYWWWTAGALFPFGVAYLISRRRQFIKPTAYILIHLAILTALAAVLVVVKT